MWDGVHLRQKHSVFSFEPMILKRDRFRVIIDVGLKSSYLALAIITKMQQSLLFPTSKN